MRLSPFSLALASLFAFGCAPVRPMPLSAPVVASDGAVQLETSQVAPSNWFLAQRGGGLSVMAVSLRAQNRSNDSRVLSLDRATLSMIDPGGELADVTLAAASSGEGAAPPVIPIEHHEARPRALRPGESVEVWVAFRQHDPIRDPSLPRRMVLRVPIEGAAEVALVLAEPSTGRPRWQDEQPIESMGYGGVHAMGTRHEGSFGILRAAPKSVAGPIVLGPHASLAFRGGQLRNQEGGQVECCDLGFGFEMSAAFKAPDNRASGGPYLGYQALYPLDRSRPDNATWHGPAIGVRLFSSLAEPRWARAFPVSTTPSRLGYSSFTLAYVHWFRSGDPGGSPGLMFVFDHATPEW